MYGTRMMENKILNVLSGVWGLWDAQEPRYRILKLSWFWSQKFRKVPIWNFRLFSEFWRENCEIFGNFGKFFDFLAPFWGFFAGFSRVFCHFTNLWHLVCRAIVSTWTVPYNLFLLGLGWVGSFGPGFMLVSHIFTLVECRIYACKSVSLHL